jgi:hypothetical protein
MPPSFHTHAHTHTHTRRGCAGASLASLVRTSPCHQRSASLAHTRTSAHSHIRTFAHPQDTGSDPDDELASSFDAAQPAVEAPDPMQVGGFAKDLGGMMAHLNPQLLSAPIVPFSPWKRTFAQPAVEAQDPMQVICAWSGLRICCVGVA